LRNGDISNELPKRILVTTEVFLNTELTVKKRLGFFPLPKINININRLALSNFYVTSMRLDYTFELISYSLTEEDLFELTEKLDKMGTNPFRYYSSYDSINHLVAELPYRPEVIGVLDIPSNLLRYGHWGLDLASL
jgi:hypothetical protein